MATNIGDTLDVARELLRLHRRTYPKFWAWSVAAVNHAMLYRHLFTTFGWPILVGGADANPRSLANFPCQANGAEMLRLACCLMAERRIGLCAPVHDAVLVEGPADGMDETVANAQAAMREASSIILDGFELETDFEIVSYPNRYSDDRGVEMWLAVTASLAELDIHPNVQAESNSKFNSSPFAPYKTQTSLPVYLI